LHLLIAFDAGSAPLDPAEVYIGLRAPFGVFWLNPARQFVTPVTRNYIGPLPSFEPTTVLRLPNAGVLPPGLYWWFVIVDRDGDGVVDGDISASVLTVITDP
jgi:hypothetical protein